MKAAPKHTDQSFMDELIEYAKQGIYCAIEGNCVYRNQKGQSCFIGHFLTEKQAKFADDDDETGINDLHGVLCEKFEDYSLAEVDLELMKEVQNVHDYSHVKYWQHELKQIAHSYGLTVKGEAA
jgi:hypothetical protein